MKLRYVVWLTCLLLFVAAIDTVPDPPAIYPHNRVHSSISAPKVSGPSKLLEKERPLASGVSQHDQFRWFSLNLASDKKLVGVCPLQLVRHAADASPPAMS